MALAMALVVMPSAHGAVPVADISLEPVVTDNLPLLSSASDWVSLPGSDLVTRTNLTINPANPSVFYRLVYP